MLETLNSKLEPLIIEADEKPMNWVVLNDQKEGMFFCPSCKSYVIKDLSKVANVKTVIRIKCKCKCGHVFQAMVERRQSFRKSVNLVGMCLYLDDQGQANKQLIKILDVSITGLQFSVNDSPEFKVGDTVIVNFKLDDRERTEIQEKAIVLRIGSRTVGLKFDSTGLIKSLGLYLMG